MLSEDEIHNNGSKVITGEEWSRKEGIRRGFVSFTDQLDRALTYANLSPSQEATLESFGIIIGISSSEIADLETFKVDSDIAELGVIGGVPTSKIKTIFAPKEKNNFVSKLIGDSNIPVVSLDSLSQTVEKTTYNKKDIKSLSKTRKISGINSVFSKFRNSRNFNNKSKDERYGEYK